MERRNNWKHRFNQSKIAILNITQDEAEICPAIDQFFIIAVKEWRWERFV